MSDVLIFVIAGLTAGSVYALAGVGLVLTYRTSAIFNFAHGALATVSAYVFYNAFVENQLGWIPSAVIAVLVLGPVMGLVMEQIARRLQHAPLAVQVALTVGLLLGVAAAVTLVYGVTQIRIVPVFLAEGSTEVLGTPVQHTDAITMALGIVATTVLWMVLRFTRLGMSMRAVVDDRELLDTAGVNPLGVQRVAWVVGATFAAASGVLFAPLAPLDPLQLTLLVVSAFGAAAIGGFRSLPLTFTGGLLIGVLASLATRYLSSDLLIGIAPSMPFLALFVVLLVFPKRKLPRGTGNLVRTTTWSAPAPLQVGVGVLVLGVLLAVPAFAGVQLTQWTSMLGTTILFLSLALLVRTSGQVSLCHVTFAAIGVVTFSHLAVGRGVPWLMALVLAGLTAIPVGALLAVPAIRLGGLYLALATFGLGILVQYMFYTSSFMFGANGQGLRVPRPEVPGVDLQSDTGYYYVVLAFAVGSAVLLVVINRSRLGRLLRGVSEAPIALETSGAAINITRVLVFCVSAFLAAIGGALAGAAQGTVTAQSYQPLQSLILLTLIVIIALGSPWNALVASIALVLVPAYVSGDDIATKLQLLFGLAAVAVLLPERWQHLPAALTSRIDRVFDRWQPRGRRPAARRASRPVTPAVPTATAQVALEVSDLRVAFGGIHAVQDVALTARSGEITGLIGPNGAGKTTTFNAISGLVPCQSGRIRVGGDDLTSARPARRARAGLGRTFQQMQLFEGLSVWGNVALGAEGRYASWNPFAHLLSSRRTADWVAQRTQHALELCEIADLAEVPAWRLSTGQRRLVDLARCMSGDHRVLLLDEPSSGLDRAETARFASVLRRVSLDHGMAIVLVEHDLELVMDLCAQIYVLDFGKLLFQGSPSEVAAAPVVRAAYLGDFAGKDDSVQTELVEVAR